MSQNGPPRRPGERSVLPPGVGGKPSGGKPTVAPVRATEMPSERLPHQMRTGLPGTVSRVGGRELDLRSPAAETPPPLLGVPAAGALDGVELVRLHQAFVSQMPPQGFTNWRRTLHIPGSTISGATLGDTVVQTVERVPIRVTRLVLYAAFFWLDEGLDPLDPDQLSPFQDQANAYGRWPMLLRANGAPLYDERAVVFDPGIPGTRVINGTTLLNQNILEEGGAHATAFYVNEAQNLELAVQNVALPAHVPSAVGVELRGYSIPTTVFNDVLRIVRRG